MSRNGRAGGSVRMAAALLGAVLASAVHAQDVRQLEVTPEKGTAPLGVVLTGPTTFVSRAHEFIATHGACKVNGGTGVFTIDWGDNPEKTAQWPRHESPDCRLTHTYGTAGTYKIRAGFFSGQADSPTPEWVGETTITITAP